MDRFTAMEVFVRVVREGSFSSAARELGMSKSAVSKYVSDLEDRLGARLLNRTTRRLSLTEVGRAYHERCAQILLDIEDIETAIGAETQHPSGLLKITAPVTFSVRHLGQPLSLFLEQNPDIVVDLNLNDRRADIVEEGFDVAVRISRYLPDSSLIAAKLTTANVVVCASPHYLRKHGTPKRPEDLRKHNCLRYSNFGTVQDWDFIDPEDEPVSVRVSGTISANNGEVLREAAIDGQGIFNGPSFLIGDAMCSGQLVPILTDYRQELFNIFAIYPHNRHLSAKVRAFVDFMKSYWGASPPWDAYDDCGRTAAAAPAPLRRKGLTLTSA